MKDGKIGFTSSWISKQGEKGTFDYHSSDPDYILPDHLKDWVNDYFDDYTGCLNIETINDKIIEAHLRLNGDTQLYGELFVDELFHYLNGDKTEFNYRIPKKHLIPLFVSKDFSQEVNQDKILSICEKFGALTVFFDHIESVNQSEFMSRLLIFDIEDLEIGLELRECIKKILFSNI